MPGNQNNEDTQRKRVSVVFLDNQKKKESKSFKKTLFF